MPDHDLILDVSPFDSAALLRDWQWLIPSAAYPLGLTKFGDLFLKSDDYRVLFVDSLDGSLLDVGAYSEGLLTSEDFTEAYRDQLSTGWVEICDERGLRLGPGQCFGWRIHPLLGGPFEFSNIQVFSVTVYTSVVGQLLRQLKERPDGAKISGFRLEE